jgi:hypothetical protein
MPSSNTQTRPGQFRSERGTTWDAATVSRWEIEERRLLACFYAEGMEDRAGNVAQAIEAGVSGASFYVPANGIIFDALRRLAADGDPLDLSSLAIALGGQLADAGGYAYLTAVSDAATSSAHFASDLAALRDARHRRTLAGAAVDLAERARDGRDPGPVLELLRELEQGGGEDPGILRSLALAKINHGCPPPRALPVLSIGRAAIATAGNLTAIVAQAKSGKTAFVGAIMSSAVLSETGEEGDTLGVSASMRPPGAVVLVFDTEQSPDDAWAGLDRVTRRSFLETAPDWIHVYSLNGESPARLRTALRAELARLRRAGVPVWFVVLDGIADFCADPNDLGESQEVVTEAHALAKESACPILCVIHRNEGKEADGSARGHLGKQLARKAAYNLRLEKEDEITTVFATQNRGAPILKKDGPRFRWCDKAGMHVTVHTAGREREDRKTTVLRDLAVEVFQDGSRLLSYSELRDGIAKARGCAPRWAEKQIEALRDKGIVRPSGSGSYALAA